MSLTRRQFIRNSSVTGGALTLGFSLAACSPQPLPRVNAADFQSDSYLRITPEGVITMQIPKAEMGQGVITGLVTLLAEELDVHPTSVQFEMAPPHPDFNDPEYRMQVTGGSNSIRAYYTAIRQVGATARDVLLQAAAQQSGLPRSELKTLEARVFAKQDERSWTYAELVPVANELPVPESVALKSAAQFRYIGQFDQRLDNLPKVDGSARFALDVPLADAVHAVLLRCPAQGGSCARWDDSEARIEPGVVDIFQIDAGIAVVAKNSWRARKAAEKVRVEWQDGGSNLQNSEDIDRALAGALDGEDFKIMRDEGESAEPDAIVLEAEYNAPFLAHATMEPQTATARVGDGRAELWIGSQAPDMAQLAVARALGFPKEAVTIHNCYLGGGFGRRALVDSAVEAALIAQRLKQPVKLLWSREDDMRHDIYRPVHKSRFVARVSTDGKVDSWVHRIASPSINQHIYAEMSRAVFPKWIPHGVPDLVGNWVSDEDHSSVEGAADLPYGFGHIEVAYKNVQTPMPLGYWRSVGHSQNAFVVESFVDELAHQLGTDPVAFRREHLPEDSRQRAVLDRVVEMSSWGSAPEGHFQGVAVHESFSSVVAEVVQISLQDGQPRLEKVYCAVDCGLAVNPDVVRAQMEGGIIFGLTAALKSRITLKEGRVQQSNFHDYPMLRMNEVPEIEVAILDIDRHPSGVGEPGTPPAAPALGNALFAATGRRLRSLPFDLG